MNTDAINAKIFEAVQEMWRRELGIRVSLANEDFRVWLDNLRTLSYQVSRSRWVGDYNDPSSYLDLFRSGSGNNQTGWSSAEYDRLNDEADRTLDRAAAARPPAAGRGRSSSTRRRSRRSSTGPAPT